MEEGGAPGHGTRWFRTSLTFMAKAGMALGWDMFTLLVSHIVYNLIAIWMSSLVS